MTPLPPRSAGAPASAPAPLLSNQIQDHICFHEKEKDSQRPHSLESNKKKRCQMALNGEAVVFPETAWSWGCLSRPGTGAKCSPLQRKPQSKALPQSRASWGLTCAVLPKAFSSLPKFNVHHPCGNHIQVTESRQKSMLEEHVIHSD